MPEVARQHDDGGIWSQHNTRASRSIQYVEIIIRSQVQKCSGNAATGSQAKTFEK